MTLTELRQQREQQEELRQQNEYHRSYNEINNLPRRNGIKKEEPTILGDDTLPMMVLRIAKTLSQPFTLTQLVLACWKSDPKQFGLPGAEDQSASDRKVYVPFCGERGLIRLNLLRKVGPYTYEVVEQK